MSSIKQCEIQNIERKADILKHSWHRHFSVSITQYAGPQL